MGYFNITPSMRRTEAAAAPEASTMAAGNGSYVAKPGVKMGVPSGHMPVSTMQRLRRPGMSGSSAYSLNNLKYR